MTRGSRFCCSKERENYSDDTSGTSRRSAWGAAGVTWVPGSRWCQSGEIKERLTCHTGWQQQNLLRNKRSFRSDAGSINMSAPVSPVQGLQGWVSQKTLQEAQWGQALPGRVLQDLLAVGRPNRSLHDPKGALEIPLHHHSCVRLCRAHWDALLSPCRALAGGAHVLVPGLTQHPEGRSSLQGSGTAGDTGGLDPHRARWSVPN